MIGAPTCVAKIHDFTNFGSVRVGERSAKNRDVLRVDEHLATLDETVAGHHPIAENLFVAHAKIGATMRDESVGLNEAAGIEQDVETLAGAETTALALFGEALRPAASFGLGMQSVEMGGHVAHSSFHHAAWQRHQVDRGRYPRKVTGCTAAMGALSTLGGSQQRR